jgi:tRNA(Ile)-lysidine synthase TilS/MesJ
MCLLHSLVRLRRLFRIRLEVFHFDHGMRRGSMQDAAYVARAAATLGLPAHLEVADESRDRSDLRSSGPERCAEPPPVGCSSSRSGARRGRAHAR